MTDLFTRITELQQQKQTFCIITVVATSGMTPRKAGARGIVFPDGRIEGTVGGGSIELEATETAVEVMKLGKPLFKVYPLEQVKDGMTCGGSMSLFYEPISPQRRLTIFGGGHVGRQIAHVAHIAGWQVRVVDHREGVLDPVYFPPEAERIAQDYSGFIKDTTFDENDWLVIVTPKHEYDETVLEHLISQEYAYLGMMGSDRKVGEIFSNLKNKGVNKSALAKVQAPVGLNFGKETPGEIAVAIVGEMLAFLNGIDNVQSCKITV
ncbi:hypothetical protein GF337_10910 [candidate division KSB1 bacterium]|nr:hypothetical protein [candidate division KSB1 bacterium]